MGGHGHDGARPVGNQHVVRDPDGDALPIHRIESKPARKRARLVLLQFGALEIRLAGRLPGIGRNLFEAVRRRYPRHKGMLRRQHHVRGPEKRIRAGREHADRLVRKIAHGKIHLGALGLADPVALHFLRAFGPVELVESFEQPLRILRDAQHPLAQRPAYAVVAAHFGLPVHHLFVGQGRAQFRAPPDGRLALERQPLFVQLEEYPLGPPEIIRRGRVDLALPVVRKAEHLELLAETHNVRFRGDARVGVRLHRVLLGGQAKGVPADRMQHIEALHALVARKDIRRRIPLGMPYVQTRSARIRKHVQDVELFRVRIRVVGRPEGLFFFPVPPPFLFYFGEGISGHACSR